MKHQGPAVSRRDLFTFAGACGVAASRPACASLIGQSEKALPAFYASCTMECIHCRLKATVKDGRIVKIESANPYEGKACARGLSRIKWIEAKDRVLTPLRRTGRRGEGKFERISWDEALDAIASRMKEAVARDGSKSILMTMASGNMDSLTNGVAGALGDYLGGVTRTKGSLCCSAVTAAMAPIVGLRYVDTRDTIDKAKFILSWGCNPLVSMQAYWPRYLKAKAAGARIVVIDPRRSETAARADEWLAIRPGTDTALALGMIRRIIEKKAYDRAFLLEHTDAAFLCSAKGALLKAEDGKSALILDAGSKQVLKAGTPGAKPALSLKGSAESARYMTVFDLIERHAQPWTLQETARATGLPAERIAALADSYASSGASMIIANMGSFQRVENGTYAAAAQFYLALLTGSIGRPGTGVCDAGGVTQMAKFGRPVPPPPAAPAKVAPIPTAKLAEYVLNDKPQKINVWYSMTCGVLGQWPNANLMVKALEHVPFLVVADSLMTPTARYADIVLPATTVFEYKTLLAGNRTHFVQWSDEAVKPRGEARPDRWIMAQLARRLGFGSAFDLTPEQMAENVLKPSGIRLEDVKKAPVCPVKGPWVPFTGGRFRTPDHRAHFYVEAWEKKGKSPVIEHLTARESPEGSPELAAKYPLMAIQHKVIRNIHTSHQHNEWLKEIFPAAPRAIISERDARSRGIGNGDWVSVYNDRGTYRARALVTRNIREGVVALENGWWFDTDGFTSSSVLTNDQIEVLGTGTCICSTLVNVRKA